MNSTKQASRQPLLHIVKRAELPRRTSALLRLGAFLLSLFIGGLFILLAVIGLVTVLFLCVKLTIKTIDKDAVVHAAKLSGNIITVEDHNILGGLGSIVADTLLEAGVFAKLKKIGVPDKFIEFGYPEEIYPALGMDANGIYKTALEVLK